MKNYAGQIVKQELIDELTQAGIYAHDFGFLINDGEVKSPICGVLGSWSFKRAWYYWVAEGDGLPVDDAMKLHEYYGKVVRVDGDCTGPSPLERFRGFGVGSYHVDSQAGLKALADCIRSVYKRNGYQINEKGQTIKIENQAGEK